LECDSTPADPLQPVCPPNFYFDQLDPTQGESLMKRFLSSCARLPCVGFAVALDALPSLPTSKKQTLAIVLLAVAVATGVMGRNASAGIVTATLNQTAVNGSPVYFSYASGTIGTLDWDSSGNMSIRALVDVFDMGGGDVFTAFNVGGFAANAGVANANPLSFGTPIDSATAFSGGQNPFADGYYGVRFSAGGSDWNYGWVAVTKTESSLTFGQASVETTINTPIAAGAVAVPEPSTYAMALAGLACGGYSLFRRRSAR
jgi:hypothetical protein